MNRTLPLDDSTLHAECGGLISPPVRKNDTSRCLKCGKTDLDSQLDYDQKAELSDSKMASVTTVGAFF
jgi:hypothetical protein